MILDPTGMPGRSSQAADEPFGATAKRLRVLVVEPEPLVRWSVVTYLSRWFTVLWADATEGARQIIDAVRVDAVVVSDDCIDDLESHARSRNAAVRVIRTVTCPRGRTQMTDEVLCLEKPFDLAGLARLLGAGEVCEK